eukprot:TRINITY_DN21453_c0_g1_i1.p3 TRINITY_DN21453_c0_g1~~TRINITY_DN21453_c0_g1_i1.p3  ORF type:complete len:186 (-),score=46.36 TRINITY_DN21453_c0_g1_i1:475-1032(-)
MLSLRILVQPNQQLTSCLFKPGTTFIYQCLPVCSFYSGSVFSKLFTTISSQQQIQIHLGNEAIQIQQDSNRLQNEMLKWSHLNLHPRQKSSYEENLPKGGGDDDDIEFDDDDDDDGEFEDDDDDDFGDDVPIDEDEYEEIPDEDDDDDDDDEDDEDDDDELYDQQEEYDDVDDDENDQMPQRNDK